MAKKQISYEMSLLDFDTWSKLRPLVYGNLSADIAFGGGIPQGCLLIVAGDQGIGKTTLCWQYAAYAHNLYQMGVRFYGVENRLTHHTLEQIQGLDKNSENVKIVSPPPIRDEQENIIGFEKYSQQKWFEVIGECITGTIGSVIIVDSLAQMCTEDEIAEGTEYADMGKSKKIESSFIRQFGDIIISRRHIVFLITQIMDNPGYGASKKMIVGNKTKYQADVIIWATHATPWPPSAKTGKVFGHDMNCKIVKSLIGPSKEMVIPLRYGYGIDNILDIVKHAGNFGIISRAGGGWYTLPFVEETVKNKKGEEKLTTRPATEDDVAKEKCIKIQGDNKIRQWFLLHPGELADIDKRIRSLAFGGIEGLTDEDI